MGNSLLGPVDMLPGQLVESGQLTDHGVNFASVYGLTSVTVDMNLSLPRGNFERCITHCTVPGNRPCQVTFLHVNRTQKFPQGKSSLAHAHY